MAKYRDFAPLDPLPADWTDAWQEYLSTNASNFRLQIKPTDNTVLQVPAGTGNDQVGITIEANPRYIAASIERVSLGGGTPRDMDVWVTSTANSFTPGIPGEVDLTNYAFALAITETGVPPGGVAIKRKVGTAHWDGTKFTTVTPTVGFPTSAALGAISVGDAAGGELAGTFPNPTIGAFAAGRVLSWGGDTNLYRLAAGSLKTDGALTVGGNMSVAGTLGVTGVASGPTAAADTNTTQLASTAFVLGQLSTVTTPLVDAPVAAIGTSARGAHADHVHPTAYAAFAGSLLTTAQAAANAVLSQKLLAADANAAYQLLGDGTQKWGAGGASATDCQFARFGAGLMRFTGTSIDLMSASSTTQAIGVAVTGDTQYRWQVRRDAVMAWSSGSAVPDAFLARQAAGLLRLTSTSLDLVSASSTNLAIGMAITGDASYRWQVRQDSVMAWGPGNAPPDLTLARLGTGSFYQGGAGGSTVFRVNHNGAAPGTNQGSVGFTGGTAANAGYVEWHRSTDGTRIGYQGFINTALHIEGEISGASGGVEIAQTTLGVGIRVASTGLGFYGAAAALQTAAPTQARAGTLPAALASGTWTIDLLGAWVTRLANAMQANGFLGSGGAWSS